MSELKNIVFLASGNGGTMKFVFNAIKQLNLPIKITGVIADRNVLFDTFLIDNRIFFKQITYNKSNTKDLQLILSELNPDLIITNIHKIIDNETLNMFKYKFINVHYSLLPSFAGLIGMETIKKAQDQNVGFVGGSCHEVNEQLDSGKIIHQGCFSVDWSNDIEIIDTVFKTSCILVLSGICTKLQIKISKTDKLQINDKTVIFSPALPLGNLNFSTQFWNSLTKQ
jgi:phosphoribosylglycinamide formyltransferase-1